MNTVLPTSWVIARLGDITTVIRGASPRPKGDPKYFGGDIPWISISDVTAEPSRFLKVTREGVTPAGAKKSRLLSPGTLILSNSGTVCVPKILAVSGCIHDGFVAFPDLPVTIEKLYLFEYFNFLRPQVIAQHRQGITQVNLNTGIVNDFEIPIPPLSEQHRIVEAVESYLSRLDEAVGSLERVQRNLKRYRASVLKAAVEGRLVPTEAELARREGRDYEPASELLKRILAERKKRWVEDTAEKARAAAEAKARSAGKPWTEALNRSTLESERAKALKKYQAPTPPDTTDLPELPEGWCWTTLESIFQTITDGDHLPPPQTASGVPFLVIGDVRTGVIDLSATRFVSSDYFNALASSRVPKEGDILYTVTGSYGIPVFVETRRSFCVQRHIAILKPCFHTNAKYFSKILAAHFVYRQAEMGATGTAQKTLGLNQLRKIIVPLPPLSEQTRILECIDEKHSLAESEFVTSITSLEKCQRLRQSIFKWAFEGKLVDQDPNDEPASVLLERIKAARVQDTSSNATAKKTRATRKNTS